jgi:hypothetical protein
MMLVNDQNLMVGTTEEIGSDSFSRTIFSTLLLSFFFSLPPRVQQLNNAYISNMTLSKGI